MTLSSIISSMIDCLYRGPLRVIPHQTFRYAAVGGGVAVLNMFLYWFSFHFLLGKQDTDFGIVVISAPILAFLIAFVVTFFLGFYLQRNVSFSGSALRGRVQLMRYGQVVVINLAINYFGLKLLVEVLEVYPSVSYALIQGITITFSYISQRFYTFKKSKK